MLYPAEPATARLRHGLFRSLYSLTIEVMAGLSLSIRTLRIRVSFYVIVKLHKGNIPFISHEIKRANSGRVRYDFLRNFPCCEARAQSKYEPFSHGRSRLLRFQFYSYRVCNGRKLCGFAFSGARRGPLGAPAP